MKPCCGRTIGAVVAFSVITPMIYFVFQLTNSALRCVEGCSESNGGQWAALGATILLVLLYCCRKPMKMCLIKLFPIACGHRKIIFTGTSSIPLKAILLSIDEGLPSVEQMQELKNQALPFLNDIKAELETSITTTTFECIFSGSAEERFGIPLSHKKTFRSMYSALYSDLDVMFCCMADTASFSQFSSDQANIRIEPFFFDGHVSVLYAQLKSLTPGFEGKLVCSNVITRQAKEAVGAAKVKNLPGHRCCGGACELTPKMSFDAAGPAIKINIVGIFEADVTVCISCPEWPPFSDWPDRPRCWPKLDDVIRIVERGCHLVAKPAPFDKGKTTWRLSFSTAEVELSKLVPETARKCFLALKVMLKDHLRPVLPELSTYHVKTIFLNTLEKEPESFWVDENIEECFLTLLKELYDALESKCCRHHWFSKVNLFGGIDKRSLSTLAKKVRRILQDPAPFIFDDGYYCMSSCCIRVPKNQFHRRRSQIFLIEHDFQDQNVSPVECYTNMVEQQERNQYPAQLTVDLPPRCQEQDVGPVECYTNMVEQQERNQYPAQLTVDLPPRCQEQDVSPVECYTNMVELHESNQYPAQ